MSERRGLLLHACCGPCTIEPLRALTEEGWDIAIAYVNPNIQPDDEYARRLATLEDYAAVQGIPVLRGLSDTAVKDIWQREVGCFGADRSRRCRACYRLRLRESARMAAEQGFSALSTTLSVSPYQLTDVIAEELEAAASEMHVDPVSRDFRPLYAAATRISRAQGMYRQNYCGCLISKGEAELERELRRKRRRAEAEVRAMQREAEQTAHAVEIAAQRASRVAHDELVRKKRAARDAARAARNAASDTSPQVHPSFASHTDQPTSPERNRA